MVEIVQDRHGIAQGELVRSPLAYPGIEPIYDWYFFRPYPNSRLEGLGKDSAVAIGPYAELRRRIDAMLSN